VADRYERIQTYHESKDDMGKWQETIIANRHAKVLDLANDKRPNTSYKSLVTKFVPTTDMEKEIQMVLIQHNATDETAEQMVFFNVYLF
jgi:U3 small nucleolar RNA-associated protein 14